MSKLNWNKAKVYVRDAAHVDVDREFHRPSCWTSPREREQRARDRREQQKLKLEEADARRLAEDFERRATEAYAKRERGEELSGFERYYIAWFEGRS
ncbi:hypothetical protein GCM10009115_05950 [Sphingopyxis soli]|uniref:Uncharacterized protein n=1 Tax=Sphingopyxis soli TaxID=592051 RepID=A0ABP3X802_9SPHN|nr:hypothetical protein [Sphingopyxis soli]